MNNKRFSPKKNPPPVDPHKLLARSLLLPVFGTGSKIIAVETTFNQADPFGFSCYLDNPEGYCQMVGPDAFWRPPAGLVHQVLAQGSLTTEDGRNAEVTLKLALEPEIQNRIAALICARNRFGRPLLAHYKGSSNHLENIRFLFELLSGNTLHQQPSPRGLGVVLLGRTTANFSLLSASSQGLPAGRKMRIYLEESAPASSVFEIDLKA